MKFQKVWFSYIAIALMLILGFIDLANFGLSLTTISTFAIAILFIGSLHKAIVTEKRNK